MEDLTKEFHACAPEEPAQTPVPAHHRFHHTRLWNIVHGKAGSGRPCEERRGAEEEEHQTDPPATDGSARVDAVAILDDFLIELQSYCREEKDLPERMRTLRFTRSGLVSPLFMRTYPEAGKKCGHPCARRAGARHLRLRVEDNRYGTRTSGAVRRPVRPRCLSFRPASCLQTQ